MHGLGPELFPIARDVLVLDQPGEQHRPEAAIAGDIGELELIDRGDEYTLPRPIADRSRIGRAVSVGWPGKERLDVIDLATELRKLGEFYDPLAVEGLLCVLVADIARDIIGEPSRIGNEDRECL